MENVKVPTEAKQIEKRPRRNRKSKMVDISFVSFNDEVKSRLDGFGISKNDYGDEILHTKIDLLLYILLRKGLVTLEEIVGTKSSNNAMVGGLISELIAKGKELADSRK